MMSNVEAPFHSDVTNSVFHVVHFLWFQEKLLRFESAKLLKRIVNFSGHSWIEVSPQIKITVRSTEHCDHSPVFIIRPKQFMGPALNFAFRVSKNCSGLHLTMVRHKHRDCSQLMTGHMNTMCSDSWMWTMILSEQ